VKCTQALPEDIEAHGGRPVMWKTGHSYIKTKMVEEDAPIAGERSGHLFIRPNDNLTLAQGTYYFESIDFGAPKPNDVHGSLTVTGPTTIHVNGDFGATANGVINTSTDPHNLTLIMSGTKFKLTGNASFYGTIIAPNADVKLSGTAEMHGALIADTIKFGGNFQFHVDESLPAVHTLKGKPMLVQ